MSSLEGMISNDKIAVTQLDMLVSKGQATTTFVHKGVHGREWTCAGSLVV